MDDGKYILEDLYDNLDRVTRERNEARGDLDALQDKLRIAQAGHKAWREAAEAAEADRDWLLAEAPDELRARYFALPAEPSPKPEEGTADER